MKKILLLMLSLLLVISMTIGLSSCKKKKNKDKDEDAKTYTLDTSSFNSTAVFGEGLSLNGLKLVEDGGGVVSVTNDMVSNIDTSSVGAKSFTVNYNGQSFTVNYAVKYRVTFVIEGAETYQYVFSADEVVMPTPPQIPGMRFDQWNPVVPETLIGNHRTTAIYTPVSAEKENAYSWTGNGLIDLEGYVAAGAAPTLTLTDLEGNPLDSSLASVDTAANKISYTLGSAGGMIVSIDGDGVLVPGKQWEILRVAKPEVSTLGDSDAIGVILGDEMSSVRITSDTALFGFNFTTTLNNKNATAFEYGGYIFVGGAKLGVSELTIIATNATNELESITLTQQVAVMPTSDMFIIGNKATEYGFENLWTVGSYNTSGLTKLALLPISSDIIGEGFYENLSFLADDTRVSIGANGAITLEEGYGEKVVNVSAVFGIGDVTLSSAPMQIRCVFDGYNVYNYEELWAETSKSDPRPIVLQSNIKDDFSATNYTLMKSTYDLTYHQNLGRPESEMMIKVLIHFRSNVYGNGYEINAHNATLGTFDSTGAPTAASIFRGPLPFVSVSESNGTSISYTMQDNIVFAVHDNVTLNNVVLKNCELTPGPDGKLDLNDLEYVGSTVEVLGDNVTIEYSRLMNGRTILRVFGDEVDPNKEINVTVKKTLIKASREFSARIGSNRFYSEDGVLAPYLPEDKDGSAYNSKNNYGKDGFDTDAYDDKFINTYVTFEDVVFEDCGIFAICVDTHFAGPVLGGEDTEYKEMLPGWTGLAKTSYGAKVTLKNDVRFYTWKLLEDVDSSTFIKCDIKAGGSLPDISFDIEEVIRNLVAQNPAYQNLIFKYEGKDYVHPGIAVLGGGISYSIVENAVPASNQLAMLNTYVVGFEDIGKESLKLATGEEPFSFMMYNNMGTFTYADQIAVEDKYACLRDN